jgi:hypothetical protein
LLCLQSDLVLNIDTKAKRELVTATRPKLPWSIQNFLLFLFQLGMKP